jgi:CO dehydrogenase maturation factor
MGRRIVTTGRGGTGKTTFTALSIRYLARPLLLIDIDPDQSLADMLGIDLEKEGVRTVLDVLYDIQKQEGYEELSSMPLPEKIQYLFNTECIYESDDFDLVSLGIKWTEGCYCAPNNLLRGIIPRLAQNYAHTLIDAPAGLEHLNRNVTSEVDDMFIVLDPSMKSFKNIERTQRLTAEVGIKYNNFYMVANYRFNDELEKRIHSDGGTYLGRIDYDALVEQYNLDGKSLLELPDDSPSAISVRRILEKAGYQTNGT